MKDHSPERFTEKFVKSAFCKPILHLIDDQVKTELVSLFSSYDLLSMDHNDRRRVSNFIKFGLTDYLGRFTTASITKSNSLENLMCLYGTQEGHRRFETSCCNRKNLKNDSRCLGQRFIDLHPIITPALMLLCDAFLLHFIWSESKIFLYDFCIPSLSMIFEYHGECWHPNTKRLCDWTKWYSPVSKMSASEQHEKDVLKEAVAKSHGFTYEVCWSSDDHLDVLDHWKQKIFILSSP